MAEPLLTTAQMNRALLARQFLLERAPVSPAAALEQVAGLQSQYAPSAYVGLWSRLTRFERDWLTASLSDRSVVQATLMRGTIHVVSAADYPLMAAGVRRARREWWLRVSKARGLDADDYQLLADKLRASLGEAPRTRSELLAEVERAEYPRHAFEGVGLWLDLVRVPPQGTWERRRADLFGLAADWLGVPDLEDVDESAGIDHLVQRYLRAFGPAPLSDISSWSGVPVSWLRPSTGHLDLRRFEAEDGSELFDLPYGPIPEPDCPAPVRFLPTWDATLLVHARRSGVLPEPFRGRVFDTKNPHSIGTVLVDGTVAATWRWHDDRIEVTPLGPSPTGAIDDEIGAEADRLAAFHR